MSRRPISPPLPLHVLPKVPFDPSPALDDNGRARAEAFQGSKHSLEPTTASANTFRCWALSEIFSKLSGVETLAPPATDVSRDDGSNDDTIEIDSEFECGNIDTVLKVASSENSAAERVLCSAARIGTIVQQRVCRSSGDTSSVTGCDGRRSASPYGENATPRAGPCDARTHIGIPWSCSCHIDGDYDLRMRNDVGTAGNTQWFYFRVRGARAGSAIRFRVSNFLKSDSLFNYGMRPAVLSRRLARGDMPDERADAKLRRCTSPPVVPCELRAPSEAGEAEYGRSEASLYCEENHSNGSGAMPMAGASGHRPESNSVRTVAGAGSGQRDQPDPSIDVYPGGEGFPEPGTGWHRAGFDCCYYPTGRYHGEGTAGPPSRRRRLYAATWTYVFPFDDDEVFFAYGVPYTYTRLQHVLAGVDARLGPSRQCRLKPLCYTLAGNRCDTLTITAPTRNPAVLAERHGAVLSARVHPGEANSSWMMEGVLRFLSSEAPAARQLRQNVVFKIVPMLNVDGVVVGNYRCSLAGTDLNRRWKKPPNSLYPTIAAMKRLLSRTRRERRTAVFCDFHGHSRKFNAFTYGCQPPIPPLPASISKEQLALGRIAEGIPTQQVHALHLFLRARQAALESRVFPHLVFRQTPCLEDRIVQDGRAVGTSTAAKPSDGQDRGGWTIQCVDAPPGLEAEGHAAESAASAAAKALSELPFLWSDSSVHGDAASGGADGKLAELQSTVDHHGCFSFKHSTFNISASKRGTGRVVTYADIGIKNSLTLEASFMGSGHNGLLRCRSKLRRLQRRIDAAVRRHAPVSPKPGSDGAAGSSRATSAGVWPRMNLDKAVGIDAAVAAIQAWMVDPMSIVRDLDTSGWGDAEYAELGHSLPLGSVFLSAPDVVAVQLVSGSMAPRHFTTQDLMSVGVRVCKALIPFCGIAGKPGASIDASQGVAADPTEHHLGSDASSREPVSTRESTPASVQSETLVGLASGGSASGSHEGLESARTEDSSGAQSDGASDSRRGSAASARSTESGALLSQELGAVEPSHARGSDEIADSSGDFSVDRSLLEAMLGGLDDAASGSTQVGGLAAGLDLLGRVESDDGSGSDSNPSADNLDPATSAAARKRVARLLARSEARRSKSKKNGMPPSRPRSKQKATKTKQRRKVFGKLVASSSQRSLGRSIAAKGRSRKPRALSAETDIRAGSATRATRAAVATKQAGKGGLLGPVRGSGGTARTAFTRGKQLASIGTPGQTPSAEPRGLLERLLRVPAHKKAASEAARADRLRRMRQTSKKVLSVLPVVGAPREEDEPPQADSAPETCSEAGEDADDEQNDCASDASGLQRSELDALASSPVSGARPAPFSTQVRTFEQGTGRGNAGIGAKVPLSPIARVQSGNISATSRQHDHCSALSKPAPSLSHFTLGERMLGSGATAGWQVGTTLSRSPSPATRRGLSPVRAHGAASLHARQHSKQTGPGGGAGGSVRRAPDPAGRVASLRLNDDSRLDHQHQYHQGTLVSPIESRLDASMGVKPSPIAVGSASRLPHGTGSHQHEQQQPQFQAKRAFRNDRKAGPLRARGGGRSPISRHRRTSPSSPFGWQGQGQLLSQATQATGRKHQSMRPAFSLGNRTVSRLRDPPEGLVPGVPGAVPTALPADASIQSQRGGGGEVLGPPVVGHRSGGATGVHGGMGGRKLVDIASAGSLPVTAGGAVSTRNGVGIGVHAQT